MSPSKRRMSPCPLGHACIFQFITAQAISCKQGATNELQSYYNEPQTLGTLLQEVKARIITTLKIPYHTIPYKKICVLVCKVYRFAESLYLA